MTELRTAPALRVRHDAQDLFNSFNRKVDLLFDDFGRGVGVLSRSRLAPRIDMCETDKEIEVTAELPGMNEKDVDVSLVDNILTISGEKKLEQEKKSKDFWFAERHFGAFSRSVQLPLGVDAASVKASLANGVLTVTVAKPAAAPIKIEVKPPV